MPYKEEETETVLPSRGARGLLERAPALLELLERALAQMERPRALGTPARLWNCPRMGRAEAKCRSYWGPQRASLEWGKGRMT